MVYYQFRSRARNKQEEKKNRYMVVTYITIELNYITAIFQWLNETLRI